MATTLEVVPAGPYFGFTRAEMLTELARYKAARANPGSRLVQSTVNGQSYTFSSNADWLSYMNDWQLNIQAAMAYIDPGQFPFSAPTNSAIIAPC